MKKPILDQQILIAYGFLTLAVLSWAINTVLARGMIHAVNPMSLSFFRWFFAMVFILPFGYKRVYQERHTVKANILPIVILSIVSVSAYNTIIYFSARYTTATNMSFVIATTPATMFIVSWIILRERASTLKTFGMLLSLSGMLVIIFKGKIENFQSLAINTGDLMTYGSVLCWAVYSVLLKHFKLTMDRIAFLTLIICIGLVFITPFFLWETALYGPVQLNRNIAGTFIFLGLFPSIISYLCWNEGVKRAGPNTASIFMYLIPVLGSLIAYIFLGEKLYLYHGIGGTIILTGLLMAVIHNKN